MKSPTFIASWLLLSTVPAPLPAQQVDSQPKVAAEITTQVDSRSDETPANVLSPSEWEQIDSGVQRALAWLASQQQPDGSFPSLDHAQPAVTSLCVLAFMAHGHNPGEGPFGKQLSRAVDFIVACQKPNGLVMLMGSEDKQLTREVEHQVGVAGAYNHAMGSLTLSEIYGMVPSRQSAAMKTAITKAIRATLQMQRWPKDRSYDRGGWRYINDYDQTDSDLSVTGWQVMFLRSARNAGFDVPEESIKDAVAYIRRTYDAQRGTFNYRINRGDGRTRGMTGAGILALGHAGFHKSEEAQRAGQELLQYSFEVYNDTQPYPTRERYHYSLFLCCQGAYQLGSPYWDEFFPRTVRAALAHQQPNGSWDAESFHRDRKYGNSYTTALVVPSFGAPNQLLPVFQR